MFVRNTGRVSNLSGIEVEDHTDFGYAGAGIALVMWENEFDGNQMRIDVSVEDWERIVRHIGIGVEESKPNELADWELEILEGSSNPLPYIVLKNSKPVGAFPTEWEAKSYLSHQVNGIKAGESYGLAREDTMTTYARKYQIEGYDAR